MRKFYLILLCIICNASLSWAQNDSSIVNHVNQLIQQEPAIHLRADSVIKVNDDLQVYFNTNAGFIQGGISETEAEMLTELLLHLITDTGSRNIVLLAKDKWSGEFKTLDYFVLAPAMS